MHHQRAKSIENNTIRVVERLRENVKFVPKIIIFNIYEIKFCKNSNLP